MEKGSKSKENPFTWNCWGVSCSNVLIYALIKGMILHFTREKSKSQEQIWPEILSMETNGQYALSSRYLQLPMGLFFPEWTLSFISLAYIFFRTVIIILPAHFRLVPKGTESKWLSNRKGWAELRTQQKQGHLATCSGAAKSRVFLSRNITCEWEYSATGKNCRPINTTTESLFFHNVKLTMLKICTIRTPLGHWIIWTSEPLGMAHKDNNSKVSQNRHNCKPKLRRGGNTQLRGRQTVLRGTPLCFSILSLEAWLPRFQL